MFVAVQNVRTLEGEGKSTQKGCSLYACKWLQSEGPLERAHARVTWGAKRRKGLPTIITSQETAGLLRHFLRKSGIVILVVILVIVVSKLLLSMLILGYVFSIRKQPIVFQKGSLLSGSHKMKGRRRTSSTLPFLLASVFGKHPK